MPVRLPQGALSGSGQEHAAVADALCAGQSVACAQTTLGCHGMSAPKASARSTSGSPKRQK
ncbi:MAG: hypothetical protein NZ533_03455 [Casimicrobiaceae bacterium]|nr:hypothetical protein [Casimicrobiaceae bacterium]